MNDKRVEEEKKKAEEAVGDTMATAAGSDTKKKAAPKKSGKKKTAPRKATPKKTTVKKSTVKESAPKVSASKKSAPKKSAPKKKIVVSDKTSEKSEVKVTVPKKQKPEVRATVPIWRTEKTPVEKKTAERAIKPIETVAPVKPKKRYRKWPIILMAFIAVVAILGAIVYVLWNIGPAEDIEIKFSKETGLYDTDIEVELSSNGAVVAPATEIRYTLNGDNPATNGKVYSGPIKLGMSELVNAIPIKATYCYIGGKCGKTYINTYILAADPEKDITLQIISLTSNHNNLYDYERGIFIKGKTYDDNIAKGMNPEEFVPGNYSQRDEDWIRGADVVLLDPSEMEANTDKGILWDQEIGIQISGGTSAADPIKSLKLVANRKYGYDKLAYSFSPSGDSTVGLAIPKKYNSLRLRAGGQDKNSGNIRSSLVSRLTEESEFDGYSATKRAVAYLNGQFYGVVDVEQNFSDSFLAKRFGLAESDDIVKIKKSESKAFAEAGVTGLFERDLNDPENREALEKMVDMDNYLKYYALEILWNNTDWPGNSFEMWRYNGQEVDGNKYSDGRWRFLIYDTDLIYYRDGNPVFFEGAVGDQLSAIMEGKYRAEGSTFPHVMESTYYRNKFVQIMQELMNGPFVTEHILKIIDEEAGKIAPAMRLYYGKQGYDEWQEWISLMKQAVVEQNQRLAEDMWTYFRVLV